MNFIITQFNKTPMSTLCLKNEDGCLTVRLELLQEILLNRIQFVFIDAPNLLEY